MEALRVVAESSPELFRDIVTYSLECFQRDRDSYHLTTDLSKIRDIAITDDNKLGKYLDLPEPRQILHVTFGSILSSDREFRQKIYTELFKHETMHYHYVSENIERHLDLLSN